MTCLSRLSPRAAFSNSIRANQKAAGSEKAKEASQMQACLSSSSSNAESDDENLGLCGLGNFQWKYSLCKMSSLWYRSWFCRSTPAFCQWSFPQERKWIKKEIDLDERASYQVDRYLDGLDLSEKLEPQRLYVTWVPCLPSCLVFSCVTVDRIRPFHPSCLKTLSSGLTRIVQEKTALQNECLLACRDHSHSRV